MLDVAKLTIINYPDPVLRLKAKAIPAAQITSPEVRQVALKMLELMHAAPGVGLAAPQVGLPWRLFVACPSGERKDDLVFINPVLSDFGREATDYEEGCLSLPDIRVKVRRPRGLTITATDLDGKPFEISDSEFPARVWQHEYDHLDGVLIIDKMTPLDRMANEKKLKELEAARRG